MGFGQIGLRPAGGVIGVGVVEADDVLAAIAAFTLDADQFPCGREERRSTRAGRFLRRGGEGIRGP